MTGKTNELNERIQERLAQIRVIREIVSESGDGNFSDAVLKNTEEMYRRLSETGEELLKMKTTESDE
ncbi:MAG: hypothetical protein MJ095_05285 [Oscillospiraceae bacterium]|nr:hypothetical protein [Oscillospiraceae bacterium]